MKRKFFITFFIVLMLVSSVFAAEWYDGLKLKNYDVKGVKNIDITRFYNVVNKYLDEPFTKELYSEIEKEIYAIEGVELVTANISDNVTPTGVKLNITIKELPQIKLITYKGNEKVKSYDLTNSLTNIKVGKYFNPSKKLDMEMAINELKDVYLTKGFKDTPITLDYDLDEEKNKVTLNFSIEEGEQTRILSLNFEGNDNVSVKAFKKIISTKAKSLFNNGYLDHEKLNADAQVIESYYTTIGYIDAVVSDIRIEDLPDLSNEKYNAVSVTFVIDEGKCWTYGGINVTGNKIYSNEEIESKLKVKKGVIINLNDLQNEFNAISDLYYDNGYISNGMSLREDRDEENNIITYNVSISEGPKAYVEDVVISGLTKTKEYVMTRELEIKPGDVFSKAKLITSAQNLYNTGLLKDLNYDIGYGSKADTVIIDYEVEEGNQMDIQFGATFGGTVNGFPISGFLQWADHNLGGRGQELQIATNISPDAQSLSFTFGDDWVKTHRWSNSISLSFSHTKNEGILQKATGDVPFDDGYNSDTTYPYGKTLEEWQANRNAYPSDEYLMNYDLLSASITYQTGYTFIYDIGRLSLDGGLSFSINKAVYDKANFTPFDTLIKQYGDRIQFSNKLIGTVTWDGRDYINNPSKGYLVSTSITYAGGFLGGLSNYVKLSESLAAYFKVLTVENEDGESHNLMFSASTNASIMLPQYYKHPKFGNGFHNPRMGATSYEMLYIDGMTNARGHEPNIDNVFMWDNMLEFGYPLVENILQAEAFVSGTALVKDFSEFKKGMDWYYSTGFGVKLKISGFPLGFYMVKTATMNKTDGFNFIGGNIFHSDKRPNSGMQFVLAISTSLI